MNWAFNTEITTFKVHFVQLHQMSALMPMEDNELIWPQSVQATSYFRISDGDDDDDAFCYL